MDVFFLLFFFPYRTLYARSIQPKPNVYHPLRYRPVYTMSDCPRLTQFMVIAGSCRTYTTGWVPSPNHKRASRNPKKHHAERAVKKKKSTIMDLKHKNTRLSDSKVNATRGISAGAASASTSKACCPGRAMPRRRPYILRAKYIE